MADDMIDRAAAAVAKHTGGHDAHQAEAADCPFCGGAARAALLAALDPPREEISAISDDSSVSFELVCSVLMALRRRAQGVSVSQEQVREKD